MTCETAQRWFSGHIDDTIEDVLKSDLEKHLKNCPGCAQYLAEFKKIDRIMKLKQDEQPNQCYWNSY